MYHSPTVDVCCGGIPVPSILIVVTFSLELDLTDTPPGDLGLTSSGSGDLGTITSLVAFTAFKI